MKIDELRRPGELKNSRRTRRYGESFIIRRTSTSQFSWLMSPISYCEVSMPHARFSLTIDTATKTTTVFLFEKQILCDSRSSAIQRADTLLILIDQLLVAHQLTARDLYHLAVRRGHGSYTGLRIGLTTAATLAWASFRRSPGGHA